MEGGETTSIIHHLRVERVGGGGGGGVPPAGRPPCRWCRTPGRCGGRPRARHWAGSGPGSLSSGRPGRALVGRRKGRCVSTRRLLRPPVTSLEFLQELTNDGQELIGAAVGEEAAHGVLEGKGLGEGRHTLLTVLIGLQRRREVGVEGGRGRQVRRTSVSWL